MDTIQHIVGWNLRRRRRQLRMSLQALAHLVGYDHSTIARYERAETSLSLQRLDALACALYCTSVDLLDPDWEMEPPHPSYSPGPPQES